MENEVFCELKKLMRCFPRSFINYNMELILIPKTNTYFLTEDCKTKNDVIAKVLMWCSRDITKSYTKRERLDEYLGATVDARIIYQKLGNAVNRELTYQFIESGFDMDLLCEELVSE